MARMGAISTVVIAIRTGPNFQFTSVANALPDSGSTILLPPGVLKALTCLFSTPRSLVV